MPNSSKMQLKGRDYYLYRAEKAMEGLHALLRMATNADCLSEDEIFGIGEILLMIKEQLSKALDEEDGKDKK